MLLKVRNNRIKITGYVESRGYDARYIKTYKDYLIAENRGLLDQVTIWKDIGKNLVVDSGTRQIIDILVQSNSNFPTHCQNGTGTNSVVNTDVDLQTPTTPRLAISRAYRNGFTANFETFFGTADENAVWAETSLWTALTSGIMLCRKLYASTFNKTSANTATVKWIWTFTPV